MKRLSPLVPRLRARSARSPSPRPSNEKYEYEALFHDNYVRVCRILPGASDQPLECELIEVPVQDCPLTYECLSYTWGNPLQSHTILCNSKDIPITKTLHSVLILLRRSKESRDLWVDQICINQQDIPERGRQVQMMADIYRNANHVFIYLGEEGDNSDAAMKYAEQLVTVAKDTGCTAMGQDVLRKHGLPGAGSKPWVALGALLLRPWFSRAWVTQEVSVAKEATLYCGKSSLNWASFVWSLRLLTISLSRLFGANLYHNGSPGERAMFVEVWRGWKGRADVFKIFTFSKNCDATNDADKLYAFTNLANLAITTDYERSTEEVYTTFAASFIGRALKGYPATQSSLEGRETKEKVIAAFLCIAGKLSQKYNLPSWVPDFSVRQQTKPFWITKDHSSYQITYSAGGDTLGDCEFDNSRGLHISVMMIDELAKTGTVDLRNTRAWSSKQLQQTCAAWFLEASAINISWQTPYINGQTRNEAFMRTLVGDVDTACRRASMEDVQRYCGAFLSYIYQRTGVILFQSVKSDHVKEQYAYAVASTILGRSFFLTQQGFIGLGPYGVRSGDEVAVMLGSDIPFLVRKKGEGLEGPEYELLGECYLHGIMFGEVWNLGCPVQRIVLK